MEIELTEGQKNGLAVALERYNEGYKYVVISGYAGTGKTTLVKFIVKALGVSEDRVAYAAFTGKAAEVLRKKGNKNSCTLHKLLYEHIPMPAGGFYRKKRATIDYDIIVADECSMIPKDMVDLLLTHKVFVIFLGDNFQLPPIDKDADNHLLDEPHAMLTEITRQAADNEIIQLSMAIREGKELPKTMGENVRVYNKNEFIPSMMTWADQVLVATNGQRIARNNEIRAKLGKGPAPEDGDKIICKRNYWEDVSDTGNPLVNGTIGTLRAPVDGTVKLPRFVKHDDFKVIKAAMEAEDGTYYGLNIDKGFLLGGEKCCDWRIAYQLGKAKKNYGDLLPKEFQFGYAITVWAAQGSEWDKVLILEEPFPYDKETHQRFLYTAVTRGINKVVLVRDN